MHARTQEEFLNNGLPKAADVTELPYPAQTNNADSDGFDIDDELDFDITGAEGDALSAIGQGQAYTYLGDDGDEFAVTQELDGVFEDGEVDAPTTAFDDDEDDKFAVTQELDGVLESDEEADSEQSGLPDLRSLMGAPSEEAEEEEAILAGRRTSHFVNLRGIEEDNYIRLDNPSRVASKTLERWHSPRYVPILKETVLLIKRKINLTGANRIAFKNAATEVGRWTRFRNYLAKPEVADAVVGGFFGAGARIGVKFLFAAKLATLPFIAASPVAAGIAAVVIAGAIGGLVSNACHRNRKKGSWRRAMLFGAAGGFIGGWIADSLYHPSVVETAKATVHPVANYSVEQAFNAAQAPLPDFSGAINPPDVSVGLTDIELPSMPDGSTFAMTNFADSIPGVDASTISDGPHAIVDTVPPVETVPTASTSQLGNIMQAAADAKAAGDIATLEKLVAGMKEISFQLINGEGATLQSKMAGAFMLEQANTIVQENNLHSASAYMVERDYKIVSGWGWSNKARAVFALH